MTILKKIPLQGMALSEHSLRKDLIRKVNISGTDFCFVAFIFLGDRKAV